MQVGKRIKESREAQNMTLTDLAQKSGVQIATLSRIENLKMTGTLDSHMHIAKALGTDITQLYQGITAGKEKSAVTAGTSSAEGASPQGAETFSYNDKASYEILIGKILSRKMLPIVLRIEEAGRTNPEQNHPGSERFIFVLKGTITAHIADAAYPLSQNNTLYFDASLKHYFTNTGKGPARAISVITPVAL